MQGKTGTRGDKKPPRKNRDSFVEYRDRTDGLPECFRDALANLTYQPFNVFSARKRNI